MNTNTIANIKNFSPGLRSDLISSDIKNYAKKSMDLHNHFVSKSASSFMIKVSGDSMINAGINNGDILIVEKTDNVKDKSIVVAEINNKLAVKRLRINEYETKLVSENEKYAPIYVTERDTLTIWGVVRSVIKVM